MDEEEVEYDIYFQGGRQDLYTFLYPLTGPNSKIFDHLQLQGLKFDASKNKFSFEYEPKEFSNIDRQIDKVTYESVCVPTHSNYFYSKPIPGEKALVWRNVKRMTELRPKTIVNEPDSKDKPEMLEEGQQKPESFEMMIIKEEDPENKVIKEINNANSQPLNRNWDVNRNEYVQKLCE